MARWQVTIAQPAGATPAIPSVSLKMGPERYSRSEIRSMQVDGYTPQGVAKLKGTRLYLYRYLWIFVLDHFQDLNETTSISLESLISWQDSLYAAEADGHLLLIDEVERLPAEPSPHCKQILSGSKIITPWGYEHGFGVFKVRVEKEENFKQTIVDKGDGRLLKKFALRALELPNG